MFLVPAYITQDRPWVVIYQRTTAEFKVIALGIVGALAAGTLLAPIIAIAVVPALVMVGVELAIGPAPLEAAPLEHGRLQS